MAQNPALTQLLTDLNAAPHPGMGNDFFAHVGSHMALARTVPPAWFPKTGTATEPTTGTLRRVSKSLEGSTAVQGGGSCLFVSHRSVESSEIENYYSP